MTAPIDVIVFPFTPDTRPIYERTPGLMEVQTGLGIWDKLFTSDQLVAAMDDAGVDKAIVCSQAGGTWEVPAEYTRDFIAGWPGRLYGACGIDPRDITEGVRKLERAVTEYGFLGAHSYPHWFGLAPDDRKYYPFYAKCVELGVPIEIQIGEALQRNLRNVGRPETLDRIAVDFPDLRIVAIHTGYPWERELVAVSAKHANVHIGADAVHPRLWPAELTRFIAGEGRTKVLWGTNKPALDQADSLAGVAELGFADDVLYLLLRGNAERVFGFPDVRSTPENRTREAIA
ncbi:amidohydrolase family protein [Amycolatopsis jejuensis]|uniref:amidohydrolase family protein n=1 Tax=Amycolatopsis jejuensis TaxID=330084 RepID=UPI0006920D51|nr:amidohydrolase family protein [Amycolatopsis jejuensis]